MVGSNKPARDDNEDGYVGLIVSGVFRLEQLIGLGTTGRVYRATQLGFARTVAIKVLHRHLMLTPTIRDRFHREARLASRLMHPGIVQVLASGELELQSDDIGGEAYLVSEYLQGVSLRQRILEHWPSAVPEALAFMIAIADAVGDAHAHRIIHRDLKPENLMTVTGDHGDMRHVVLDFGLARALDLEQDPLTREGAILGTPQYMSPEAARGRLATPQSDVYSLATILYELLTGQPPFTAASPMMVLLQQAEADPPLVAKARNVPSPVADVVQSELAKAPEARSRDARCFALRLFRAAVQAGIPSAQLQLPQLSDDFLLRLESDAE